MDVINAIVVPISQCFAWFDYLMLEFGTLPLWTGIFVVWTVNRFVIQPITGAVISSGSSEFVSRKIFKKKKGR